MKKNKTLFYGTSALLWLLVALVSYFLYSSIESKNEVEQHLLSSANRIYQLHKEGFEKKEEYRYRHNAREYSEVFSHGNLKDREILNSLVTVQNALDSFKQVREISFTDVESHFLQKDFTDYQSTKQLALAIENQEVYQRYPYCGFYKNFLLSSLIENRDERFVQLGSMCGFRSIPFLHLFDKNKVGLALGASDFDVAYAIYPLDGTGYLTTKSSSFEFEVIVKKLGRKPEMITTKYRTIPQEDGSLGTFDYEQVGRY